MTILYHTKDLEVIHKMNTLLFHPEVQLWKSCRGSWIRG